MGTETLGKVLVPARLQNVYDLHEASLSDRTAEAVRRDDVSDGPCRYRRSTLSVPKQLVAQLGLKPLTSGEARQAQCRTRYPPGIRDVRLTVQGRDCLGRRGGARRCPVLIGQVPLELLYFVTDPSGQRPIEPRSRRRTHN